MGSRAFAGQLQTLYPPSVKLDWCLQHKDCEFQCAIQSPLSSAIVRFLNQSIQVNSSARGSVATNLYPLPTQKKSTTSTSRSSSPQSHIFHVVYADGSCCLLPCLYGDDSTSDQVTIYGSSSAHLCWVCTARCASESHPKTSPKITRIDTPAHLPNGYRC